MDSHQACAKSAGDKDSAYAAATAARASGAKHPCRRSRRRKPVCDTAWMVDYPKKYEAKSEAGRRSRTMRRARDRRRVGKPKTPAPEANKPNIAKAVASTPAEDKLPAAPTADTASINATDLTRKFEMPSKEKSRPSAGDLQCFADLRRARGQSKRDAVELRWKHGFIWHGGPVAKSKVYFRRSFCYKGLVSNEHPILKLFVSKVPKAARLHIGDHKAESYTSDSKLLALDAAYVEDNKKVCGVLRAEIDAILSWDEITLGCQAAGVPLPNVAVGWEDSEGRVYHPHLIWLLHDSVPLEGRNCARFDALYRGVLRGLTKALIPLGGDPGGLLNSHRHKNPLSPLWARRIYAEQPYELGFLRQHVDTKVSLEALQEMSARTRTTAPVPDHPDPLVAGGSNRFFAHLSSWARREVGPHRAAGGGEQEFAAMVALEAYRSMTALGGSGRGSERTALATAEKVSRWTWQVYKGRLPKRVTTSSVELAAAHAAGGRKAAAHRKAHSERTIVTTALQLAKTDGRPPTQASVLAAVTKLGVTSERTVRRHWQAVQAALTNHAGSEAMTDRTNAVPYVKKGLLLSCLSVETSAVDGEAQLCLENSSPPAQVATAVGVMNSAPAQTSPRPVTTDMDMGVSGQLYRASPRPVPQATAALGMGASVPALDSSRPVANGHGLGPLPAAALKPVAQLSVTLDMVDSVPAQDSSYAVAMEMELDVVSSLPAAACCPVARFSITSGTVDSAAVMDSPHPVLMDLDAVNP
jgi:hypothetical protein